MGDIFNYREFENSLEGIEPGDVSSITNKEYYIDGLTFSPHSPAIIGHWEARIQKPDSIRGKATKNRYTIPENR